MMTSTLPIHGALVDIANRIAERHRHVSFAGERLRAFEPVANGLATCPTCHILWNKPSTLAALEDKSDDASQYECSQCRERYKLGR